MNNQHKVALAILSSYLAFAVASLLLKREHEIVDKYDIGNSLPKFEILAPVPKCGRWRDHMPNTRDATVYRTYIAARKLWRSKRAYELTAEDGVKIIAGVSDAADKGDWGAKALMSHFYLNGLGLRGVNEMFQPDLIKAVDIMHAAAVAGQAWGYYDLGVAYENGYGDLPANHAKAWALFSKAAELGSPEAQLSLAEAYDSEGRFEEGKTMRLCAYEQGDGKAAYELGEVASVEHRYQDSIDYFQKGVAYGSADAASSLFLIFSDSYVYQIEDEKQRNLFHELGFVKDQERIKRYSELSEALTYNPDLRFPRVDAALPLPPAKLAPWRGIEDAMAPETDAPPSY